MLSLPRILSAATRVVSEGIGTPAANWSDDGAPGWNEVGGSPDSLQSLTGVNPDVAMRQSVQLDKSNGTAKAIINLITGFVAGDDLLFDAEDEQVQNLLDEWWVSDWNQWDKRLYQRVRDWRLTGMLLLHQQTNPVNGFVRISLIPSNMVRAFKHTKDDAETLEWVKIARGNDLVEDVTFSIVRPMPEKGTVAGDFHRGVLEGDVFYLKANSTSTDPRGYSDLMAVGDWLTALDDMLFTSIDRANLELMWQKHVKAPGVGSSAKDDALLRKEFQSIKPGTVALTGPDVEVSTIEPALAGAETAREALTIVQHIAGMTAIPPHMLGRGEDANRATSDNMAAPTMKFLDSIRRDLISNFEIMGRFVVQQAISVGRLPANIDLDFQVVAPTIAEDDVTLYGQTLVQVVQAAMVAMDAEIITKETSAKMIRIVAAKMGVEFDPEKELSDAEDQADGARRQQEIDDDEAATAGVREAFARAVA